MRNVFKNLGLKPQLIFISSITILISLFSLIIILPNFLTPFYEKNIYEVLKQPIPFIKPNQHESNNNVAFVLYDNIGNILVSDNYQSIVLFDDINILINNITSVQGKFKVNHLSYYYHTERFNNQRIITITDDTYIKEQKHIFNIIAFPIIILTSLITILILILYSNYLVKKISKIKSKIDNFDNPNYQHNYQFEINDELNQLLTSIDQMRISLQNKEAYKNNMFQSISHELKTPIMVITSYIEAANDQVVSSDEALKVVREQTNSLNHQVEGILKLNKINYLKMTNNSHMTDIDLKPIITDTVNKLKIMRPDIMFKLDFRGHTIFNGTDSDWRTVVDNILNNFLRYAKKVIKISIKNNQITFFNDGEPIEKDIINNIFDAFSIGPKGEHGLGLYITKQILDLFGYHITVTNSKQGVSFKIM